MSLDAKTTTLLLLLDESAVLGVCTRREHHEEDHSRVASTSCYPYLSHAQTCFHCSADSLMSSFATTSPLHMPVVLSVYVSLSASPSLPPSPLSHRSGHGSFLRSVVTRPTLEANRASSEQRSSLLLLFLALSLLLMLSRAFPSPSLPRLGHLHTRVRGLCSRAVAVATAESEMSEASLLLPTFLLFSSFLATRLCHARDRPKTEVFRPLARKGLLQAGLLASGQDPACWTRP